MADRAPAGKHHHKGELTIITNDEDGDTSPEHLILSQPNNSERDANSLNTGRARAEKKASSNFGNTNIQTHNNESAYGK